MGCWIYDCVFLGTSLRDAGGDSFMAAVKELSDKQNLAVGEGKGLS